MLAGPITDAQILYKPSKDLFKYIKSLRSCEDPEIPLGVANICAKPTKAKIQRTPKERPSIIQTSDIEFIDSLELDDDPIEVVEPSVGDCKQSDKLLNFEDLLWLHKFIEKRNENLDPEECVYFHKLFQGSEIILPKNVEVPRSKELEARCVKLRHQQENRQYKAMTKNVDSTRQTLPEDTISYQMKQINTQLIAVFQFVVSVLTGFAFGFIGLELMVGQLDFGFRLLLGIICALIIALAELYFLAKKLNEDLDYEYMATNGTLSKQDNNTKVKTE